MQLVILDLETGKADRPFNAPVGAIAAGWGEGATEVVWSPEGKWLLAPFTFTEEQRCGEQARGSQGPAVYAFDTTSSASHLLQRFDETSDEGWRGRRVAKVPQEIKWLPGARHPTITISYGPTSTATNDKGAKERVRISSFELVGTRWRETRERMAGPLGQRFAPVRAASGHAALEVRAGYNVPPAIYALGKHNSSRLLYDLAAHARARALGSVERYQWVDSIGHPWRGLLALPADYRRGLRYPLIVQTHGEDLFLPHGEMFFAEGSSTTAFPGRAATGRGFIVLTIDETSGGVDISRDRSNEAPKVIDGYGSAIRSLAENGLIEPTKVGAIGWSRTSYYVKYALTHAPELFAAAVAVDGVDYGLWQYFGWLDMPGRAALDAEFQQAYAGTPWARGNRWGAEAPIFGVDKVRAPVLGGANSLASTALSEWEFYAGLRRLNKPADLILYPQGQHVLVDPLYRRYSTQISLDWLDYWINGYRDPDPSKNEQYARWESMRPGAQSTPLSRP
jgi:dipeptidyl aminopeptidase/acylaminoacyl peptidase